MADLEPLFREMIQTLRAARASMENELELLSKAEAIGQPLRQRLAQVSAEFYEQAKSLLDTMTDCDADPDLVGQAEEVVEDLKDTAERLDRLGSAGKLPVSALLRHGPTVILGLLALMLLATVFLTILRPPSPIPLGSQLAMRAVGFVLVGICYVGLRPLAVLAREGLRLRGTIVDYEVRQSKNGTLLWPIVRIEDPPFAGRQFTSRTTFYLWFRFRHPPGSPHSVLAHPTREVFELNRLGRGNIALLVGAIAGVLSFLMPEMVAWLSR